jgi:hypothetical protein
LGWGRGEISSLNLSLNKSNKGTISMPSEQFPIPTGGELEEYGSSPDKKVSSIPDEKVSSIPDEKVSSIEEMLNAEKKKSHKDSEENNLGGWRGTDLSKAYQRIEELEFQIGELKKEIEILMND